MKKPKNLKSEIWNLKFGICNLKFRLCLSVFICGFIFLFPTDFAPLPASEFLPEVFAETATNEIEKAMFKREEFFGAQAIVPLPTFEARENLLRLVEAQPDDARILEKLAEACEKLERYDEAEKNFLRLAEIEISKLETLAAFYHRRARFPAEAEVLRKILFSTAPENRAAVFERLIDLARIHDLKNYLNDDFYAEVIKENPDVFEIFEKLIGKLSEEKNYAEALKFTRRARAQFPERKKVLLEKEISLLLETGQAKKAERVFQAAFDPFWSDVEASEFYDFLNSRNRLRAYGAEIKNRFRKNPADFDAAIRLAHYSARSYWYRNGEFIGVISRLEQAKKFWTTEQLVIVARLLLRENELETASRFLYTIYAREDFKRSSALRAQILYQLFAMFSAAENQKLSLAKGDLRFYEDVARADTSPGIATGILSLIFSDTNPQARLDEQEAAAGKFFNRAAAYRIFEEYKKEFPTSTELAQMYLDIVRLYAAEKDLEIAERTLREFAERFENSDDYAAVALKLAESFAVVRNREKEREIYQKILDYTGAGGAPKFRAGSRFPSGESVGNFAAEQDSQDDDSGERQNDFAGYAARENSEITYERILETYVASLAAEDKTAEILALYSNEIAKYPNEERLYELRLAHLEQTKPVAEQLEAYKTALEKFPGNSWREKLARWFLRHKRQSEFAEFSAELVGKLNDAELENYLSNFVDGRNSASNFDKILYLKLYQKAHERFPQNISFVSKLLDFYRAEKREGDWRRLAAEYFFRSPETREKFLDDLSLKGELREYLARAAAGENVVYELFRADASLRLSDFESAIAAYRKLNRIYPHETQFAERLINLARSFGQKNRADLNEAAQAAKSEADFLASSVAYRTRGGELRAELGDYAAARGEWEKLIPLGAGTKEIYLETATVYWDYFQYDDALRTIGAMREKFGDPALYAFEAGAVYEAQSKQTQAIAEYVSALGAGNEQKNKAKKRLAQLTARENSEKSAPENLLRKIEAAFREQSARRADNSLLSLGYAEFLAKSRQTEMSERVLNRAIAHSRDEDFLEAAREFYRTEENKTGEQIALRRLAGTAENPRRKIQFQLQLAENLAANGGREAAKIALRNLARAFPTNYGVITETADFYWRLGFENEAVAALQNALPKSRGAYRRRIAQKLASRLIKLERLAAAEKILAMLRAKNKTDTEIFEQLARIYVRLNDAEKLRRVFAETVAELKKSEIDRRELDARIAALREPMIDAFTRLKDYKSAVEQHIEIINRDAKEENIESAIRYVQRYGGAEILLNYYLKLSAEAFKNYRWNVVLARIYAAHNDFENAVENYRTAISNQPEMAELYLAVAEIETRRSNFEAALENINEVLSLTGDEPDYVKKKIEILRKAERFSEIEAEKAKLPAETQLQPAADEFAEARKLKATEKEKSRALYREAFAGLLENPLYGEMKTADLTAYVEAAREEEPVDKIAERFWLLRGKLIEIAAAENKNAGAARRRLSTLDAAMTEAIGAIAGDRGTDEELAALHDDWQNRIAAAPLSADAHQRVSLVYDLSRRARFGDLEEMILRRKLDETIPGSEKRIDLQNLVNFYNERGAYQKTFAALEKYGSDDLPLRAETARLVGDRERELEALREIYRLTSDKTKTANAETLAACVARYLEILHAENRAELKSLTETSSAFQLQLVNFLLGRGERELAHAAIENSNFPPAWKLARNAETSLALNEFDEGAECYFCEALQFDSIGEMTKQAPDKRRFLVGDDWFRLARGYGEWLFERNDKEIPPAKFLPAMIENQPRNPERQFELGEFYLQKREFSKAAEHFRLAIEIENTAVDDGRKLAALGAAYYLANQKDSAEKVWTRIFAESGEDDFANIEKSLIYFQTLSRCGLPEKAREKILPAIIEFLQKNNADRSEKFRELVRETAASFSDEREKSFYFREILNRRPTDISLAEMLLEENLIDKKYADFFYERLFEADGFSANSDYEFTSVLRRVYTTEEAEAVYEQENDFQPPTADDKRLERRKMYLDILIERGENERTEQFIKKMEAEFSRRAPRPAWLKLAKMRAQIRAGRFDPAQAERFAGIIAAEKSSEIKPPNPERFNEVLRVLKAEKREAEAVRISEAFFARNLSLGRFEAANFVGLAQTAFEKGEPEKALRILRTMIDTGDASKRETALAAIAAFEEVAAQAADAAKISGFDTAKFVSQTDALQFAAEIAFEFGKADAAIEFRQKLSEIDPDNAANKIEFAKILSANKRNDEASMILREVVANKNSPRAARWLSRSITGEIPDLRFDAFSQFYQGVFRQNVNAGEFFINSLIADKDAEIPVRHELIKLYALNGKPFAALKFAENDKSAKSDQLLRILSEAAEDISDYAKAIEFEKAGSNGGNAERIAKLQKLADEKTKNVTDFRVDAENTRKL